MLLTKTIKLKLYLNSEQITLFKQMSEQYRLACNFVSQYIFDNNFDLNSNRLNKELYRCTRLKFNLKSQLTQSVFVEKYGSNTLFVLEDLTGISFEETNLNRGKKADSDLRSWAFYQLEQFLTYKAHEVKSEVLKVSARYTSQRCPKCGSINKANRHHNIHEYICRCGYRSNDDRVGAMNIQLLGTLWISGDERPHFEKITTSD